MTEPNAALTTAVGFAILPQQTFLEVRGADRAAFLHNLCTNDIRGLKPGACCEAFFTNVQGKILGFINVYCEEEAIVLETVPGQADTLLTHLDRYLIREDVELHDRTGDWSAILIAGPQAESTLATLIGQAPPTARWSHDNATIGQHELTIHLSPLVGENGWMLRCSADATADITAELTKAGGVACDRAAVDVLRLESGSPLYGTDITDANLPQEVHRDATAISFTKGCYLGQETVARIDALGHVNKILRGVRVTGTKVPEAGSPLSHEGTEVGQITSAVFSTRLGAPLALAYLRRGHETIGTKLTCGENEAEIVALPV